MEHVIVERVFAEPIEEAELARMGREGKVCFEARNVRPVRTFISKDRRRAVCEYEAPDAESVRQANEQAGIPFERVWTAKLYEPAPEPTIQR